MVWTAHENRRATRGRGRAAACAYRFGLALPLVFLAPAARAADDTPEPPHGTLKSWARKFELQYCSVSCDALNAEAAAARAANADTTAGPALRQQHQATAQISAKDAAACQAKWTAQREEVNRQIATLDCDHVLALAARGPGCGWDIAQRQAACSQETAEAARRVDQAKEAEQRRVVAERAALLKDEKLMLMTYSAALCVYAEARKPLLAAMKNAEKVSSLGLQERPDDTLSLRLRVIDGAVERTRTDLRQRWHVPPMACSDRVVAHVADCLWLDDFEILHNDYPGTLPPDQCAEPLVKRVLSVGSLRREAEQNDGGPGEGSSPP
jgi:hypothetical protein